MKQGVALRWCKAKLKLSSSGATLCCVQDVVRSTVAIVPFVRRT